MAGPKAQKSGAVCAEKSHNPTYAPTKGALPEISKEISCFTGASEVLLESGNSADALLGSWCVKLLVLPLSLK